MRRNGSKREWLDAIEQRIAESGASFERDFRRVLAELQPHQLAAVHLLLVLVRDPVARRYQKQRLLHIPAPAKKRSTARRTR